MSLILILTQFMFCVKTCHFLNEFPIIHFHTLLNSNLPHKPIFFKNTCRENTTYFSHLLVTESPSLVSSKIFFLFLPTPFVFPKKSMTPTNSPRMYSFLPLFFTFTLLSVKITQESEWRTDKQHTSWNSKRISSKYRVSHGMQMVQKLLN